MTPRIGYWLKDNEAAIRFAEAMGRVLHLWDDLIDRDRVVPDDEIQRAMWAAMVDLPVNPFYLANIGTLQPLLMQAIFNWRIATAMEREPFAGDLHIAFILRSSYVDLLVMSAAIIGGPAWAVGVGPEIRRWAHNEQFPGYVRSLAIERENRESLTRAT